METSGIIRHCDNCDQPLFTTEKPMPAGKESVLIFCNKKCAEDYLDCSECKTMGQSPCVHQDGGKQ